MSSEKNSVEENLEQNPEDQVETLSEEECSTIKHSEAGQEMDSGSVDIDENSEDGLSNLIDLEKAQTTIKEYWDQNVRLQAEMDNYRKRAQRDVENAHKYAVKSFSEALLPVVDSMEMGQIAAESESATLESIQEGNRMTLDLLVQTLEKHGIRQIDPAGEKFDPDRHQAISMVEDETVTSNHVISVMQKGFLINDRLVRPAMVVVAK
ncbi:MAG: molecular chaperone GrpE [Gammaproteobacteria bacterium]|jgi:molecular chaperone GrpE